MNELDSFAGLEDALAPAGGARVLYKHSTQCGISESALEQLETFLEHYPHAAPIYYLDLLEHRDLSDAISLRLGVKHESPQAIVLKDGKVVAVLNHRAIRVEALARALAPERARSGSRPRFRPSSPLLAPGGQNR